MKQTRIYLLVVIVAALTSPAGLACDSGTADAYYTAYASRSGADAITYVDATITGPDSEYDTITVKQTSYLNGGTLSSVTGSSESPGDPVETSRVFDINLNGFGTYSVQGYVSVHDACTGVSYPPYTNGASPYTNTAKLTIQQPTVVGATLGTGSDAPPAEIFVDNFTPNPPPKGVTIQAYLNHITWSASYPGITGTPQWTFSGSTSDFTISCTSCVSPVITSNGQAVGACSVALTGTYTVDGLQSSTGALMVLAPVMEASTDLGTGNHIEDLAVPGGYQSNLYFDTIDSCKEPMVYSNMHEAFPYGFLYEYANANWAFPAANHWNIDGNGQWIDAIGQTSAPGIYPAVLAPQNPLGSVEIYLGYQQIFVDPLEVGNDNQVHYQDHGRPTLKAKTL